MYRAKRGVWESTQENSPLLYRDTTYYQDVWKNTAGEKLHADEVLDNPVDKYCPDSSRRSKFSSISSFWRWRRDRLLSQILNVARRTISSHPFAIGEGLYFSSSTTASMLLPPWCRKKYIKGDISRGTWPTTSGTSFTLHLRHPGDSVLINKTCVCISFFLAIQSLTFLWNCPHSFTINIPTSTSN